MKTMHMAVYEYLMDLIQKGHDGDLLPSQSGICETFKVSNITARRALGDLEKQGLIYRQKGKGSFIKKVNKPRTNLKIFLILPARLLLESDFINGIISRCRASETGIYIYHYKEDDYDLMRNIENNFPDGALWVAPNHSNIVTLERIRESGCPIIAFNRIFKNSHINYISVDHFKGAEKITTKLINAGHRYLGFAGFDTDTDYSMERHEGFLSSIAAHKNQGIKSDTVNVHCSSYVQGALVDGISAMLERFKPTAILCSQGAFLNDLLSAVKNKKIKIPDKLDVATFDAVPYEIPEKKYIHEVIQPVFDMGKTAVNELAALINGNTGICRNVLVPDIIMKYTKQEADN